LSEDRLHSDNSDLENMLLNIDVTLTSWCPGWHRFIGATQDCSQCPLLSRDQENNGTQIHRHDLSWPLPKHCRLPDQGQSLDPWQMFSETKFKSHIMQMGSVGISRSET